MPVKKPVTKRASQSSVVQLWYGENQPMLELELMRWQEEWHKKYPGAAVTKLNYEASQADDLASALSQAAFGGSLFSDRRLLILTDFLKAEAKSELAVGLKALCSNPPSGTFVVLAETGKVAWSKPLPAALKELAEAGAVTRREFLPLAPIELERWIAAQVKREGGQVAPGAARLLAALVGDNGLLLTQEIAKLVAYRGREPIRAADLDALVTSPLEEDVFVFLDAVGKRDLAAAHGAVLRQLEQGTSAQSLVGLLAWHLRVLTSVRVALDRATTRPSARELAQTLALHPFVVSKALQQIPYYSRDRLAWLYKELSALDVKLKSSRVEPSALFAVFLGKLANLKLPSA